MKRAFNKNKTLFFYIISYILILILPTVVGVAFYAVSLNAYREAINDFQITSIQQLQNYFDANLNDIIHISDELSLDQNVIALTKTNKASFGYAARMAGYRIQQKLKQYVSTNDFIDEIYLCFDMIPVIFSSDGTYNDSTSELFERNSGFPYSNILELLRVTRPNGVDFTVNDSDRVLFFRSVIPDIRQNTSLCSIAVKVNGNELDKIFKTSRLSSETCLGIFDGDNRLVWRNENFPLQLSSSDLDYLLGANPPLKSGEYYLIYSGSSVSNWLYLSAVPENIYYREFRSLINSIILYIIICLLGGGILAFFFSKRNYSPVKRIIESFLVQLDEVSYETEFQFIEEQLQKLLRQVENYKEEIFVHQQNRIHTSLAALIEGKKFTVMEAYEYLAGINCPILTTSGCIAIIDIKNYGTIVSKELKTPDRQSIDLVHFIFRNVTDELLARESCMGYMFEFNGYLLYAISFSKSAKQSAETNLVSIRDICGHITDFMEKHFKIIFTVSLGLFLEGASDIASAYNGALQAKEYADIIDDHQLVNVYPSHFPGEPEEDFDAFYSRTNQLKNLLLVADYQKAATCFIDIMDHHIPRDIRCLKSIKNRQNYLFELIKSALSSSYSTDKLTLPLSLPKMEADVLEIFSNLQAEIDSQKNKKQILKAADIADYILKNYHDYSLSVESIADHFDLSSDQVTLLIKTKTGMRTLEYIHHLRLKEAKELIASSKMTIKQIAEFVGFSNSLALNRVFKKNEGVTPTMYREYLLHETNTASQKGKKS